MNLSILYRGPLSSCNYACNYCPFAKRVESKAELDVDRGALERFVGWASEHSEIDLGVLFTPWGEALTRTWYRTALIDLTNLPHVRKAAIQTNLSARLDWVRDCHRERLALWCTYHPGEVSRTKFLAQCRLLLEGGVRFSVGVVGMHEHLAEIEAIRAQLPPDVYVWVNAYKRDPNYYTPEMVNDLTRIDPLFPVNAVRHASLGEACRTGESVVSVDGDGTVRRCHFVAEPLGNLYEPGFASRLSRRPCPNATCGCHIGYVHLESLGLYERFGNGALERVPVGYR